MTTHYVDIRLKSAGITAPWEALTQEPIPFKDAKALVSHIGSSWECRVRPSAAKDDVATMLERLSGLVDVAPALIAPYRAAPSSAPTDMVLNILRSGVFGVFETYRGKLELARWRP